MPKYCPKCKAEVKEGVKFCINFGAQLQAVSAAQPQQPMPPPAMPQQTYAPMQPKKSNMKLIGALIAIIVIVIVVVVVVVLFIGGGGGSEQFIGTWDVEMTGDIVDMQWTFNNDGTLDQTIDYGYETPSTTSTTWRVENNKLYIGETSGIDLPIDTGMSYDYSNGGNKVTLIYSYGGLEIPAFTLIKV